MSNFSTFGLNLIASSHVPLIMVCHRTPIRSVISIVKTLNLKLKCSAKPMKR